MLSSLLRSRLAFVFFVSGLAVAAGICAEQAPAPHFPTTEDLRHLKSIGGPQLSPDGKQVLFTVVDATADGAKAHVWLVATTGVGKGAADDVFAAGRQARRAQSAMGAGWISAIFFLAHRGEHTQLFRLDLRGGEAAPYDLKIDAAGGRIEGEGRDSTAERGEEGADKKTPTGKTPTAGRRRNRRPKRWRSMCPAIALSADGKWLAVWARDPQDARREEAETDAKADASWVNHEKHGTRLYLAALKADGTLDGALTSCCDRAGCAWSCVVAGGRPPACLHRSHE